MSSWKPTRRPAIAYIALLLTLAALWPRPVVLSDPGASSAPVLRAAAVSPLALVAKERGKHYNPIGVSAAPGGVPIAPESADSLRSRVLWRQAPATRSVAAIRPNGTRAPPSFAPSSLG